MLEDRIQKVRARYCELNGIDDSFHLAEKDSQSLDSMDKAEKLTEFIIQSLKRSDLKSSELASLARIRMALDEFVIQEAADRREDGEFYREFRNDA